MFGSWSALWLALAKTCGVTYEARYLITEIPNDYAKWNLDNDLEDQPIGLTSTRFRKI